VSLDAARSIELCLVHSVDEVQEGIYVLRFQSKRLASSIQAGQFINIKPDDIYLPLLRRPFSVYRVADDMLEIIFNVVGRGTKILAGKKRGDRIDVLGPLGVPYRLDGDFQTAVLVAGGLGVAPMPILSAALGTRSKKVMTFLGGRSKSQVVSNHLDGVSVSTDDGSLGFKGTVVDLLESKLSKIASPKIFACGPNVMLRSLSALARKADIACEASLESAMACGFGICQGCPVENVSDGSHPNARRYSLICKEGPVFDSRLVVI